MDRKPADVRPPLQFRKKQDETCADLLDIWLSLSENERKKQFISTSEAALLVGRCQRTIQEWIGDGRIQAIPAGKKYEVQIASLKNYLKSHPGIP